MRSDRPSWLGEACGLGRPLHRPESPASADVIHAYIIHPAVTRSVDRRVVPPVQRPAKRYANLVRVGRSGKHHQEQNPPNMGPAFWPSSVQQTRLFM